VAGIDFDVDEELFRIDVLTLTSNASSIVKGVSASEEYPYHTMSVNIELLGTQPIVAYSLALREGGNTRTARIGALEMHASVPLEELAESIRNRLDYSLCIRACTFESVNGIDYILAAYMLPYTIDLYARVAEGVCSASRGA
jgi:hypothetical protein